MHFGTTYNRKIAQMQHDKAWLLQTSHDCDSQSAPAAHLAMTATTRKSAVMFVCLGNICRSPTAEALFRQRLVELKLDSLCAVASCGTDADTGCDADDRTQEAGLKIAKIDLSTHSSQRLQTKFYTTYTHLVCMDQNNLKNVKRMAPKNVTAEISSFMTYHPKRRPTDDVFDPYYSDMAEFENCVKDLQQGMPRLLEHVLGADVVKAALEKASSSSGSESKSESKSS